MRVGLQFIDNDEERDLRYVLLLSKQYLRNCNHNFCQTFTLRSRSTRAFTFALSFPSHAPSWRNNNNVNFRSESFRIKRYIWRLTLPRYYFILCSHPKHRHTILYTPAGIDSCSMVGKTNIARANIQQTWGPSRETGRWHNSRNYELFFITPQPFA